MHSLMFAHRRNRLTMHFAGRISVVKLYRHVHLFTEVLYKFKIRLLDAGRLGVAHLEEVLEKE